MNKRLRAAGYVVDYLLADSKGNSAESIRGMTDHYLNGTLAFIGPENTCAFEARVAAAWNLPMIGFVSTVFSTVSYVPRPLSLQDLSILDENFHHQCHFPCYVTFALL